METYTLTQRELQRIAVISDCVQGRGRVDRAAQLLDLSPRHIKRLKRRYRQGGEAAMAHASRGRPSPRRLPAPVRQHILTLARDRYAGFNDQHMSEQLLKTEGISVSRETLRRLLRAAGIGSPRTRRAPLHRQRRLRRAREGEMLQLDGSPHDWLQGRGPRLTLLGFQDDATGKMVAAEFFSSEESLGYFLLLHRILRRYGIPLSLYGDHSSIFVRNDEHWTREEELRTKMLLLGITFIAAKSPQAKGRVERLWGCFQDRL